MPKTVSNTPSVYSFLRIADDASIPDNARVKMDGNSPKACLLYTSWKTP